MAKKAKRACGLIESLKQRGTTWHCGGINSIGTKIPRHSTGCKNKGDAYEYLKTIDRFTLAEFEAYWAAKEAKAEGKILKAGLSLIDGLQKCADAMEDDDPEKGSGTKGDFIRINTVEIIGPLDALDITHVIEVRPDHCRQILKGWQDRGLSTNTINTYRGASNKMFAYLARYVEDAPKNPWMPVEFITQKKATLEEDILEEEKMDGIDGDMDDETAATLPIDEDSWQLIRAQVVPFFRKRGQYRPSKSSGLTLHPENWLALLDLLHATGMRIGDALKFRPWRIAPDGGYKWKQGKLNRQKQKNRIVKTWLEPELADRLRALPGLPWRGRKDFPFAGQYPFWDGSGKNLKKYMDVKIGNPLRLLGEQLFGKDAPSLRPHRFRDTFAVNMLVGDATVDHVTKMLGHSNPQMTRDHYLPFVTAIQDALGAKQRAARKKYAEMKVAGYEKIAAQKIEAQDLVIN